MANVKRASAFKSLISLACVSLIGCNEESHVETGTSTAQAAKDLAKNPSRMAVNSGSRGSPKPADAAAVHESTLDKLIAETDPSDLRSVQKVGLFEHAEAAEIVAIVRAGASRVKLERLATHDEFPRTSTEIEIRELWKGDPPKDWGVLLQWGEEEMSQHPDGFQTLREGREYLFFGRVEPDATETERREAPPLVARRIVPLDEEGETSGTSMPSIREIRRLVLMAEKKQ